jgi:hypothetical protein
MPGAQHRNLECPTGSYVKKIRTKNSYNQWITGMEFTCSDGTVKSYLNDGSGAFGTTTGRWTAKTAEAPGGFDEYDVTKYNWWTFNVDGKLDGEPVFTGDNNEANWAAYIQPTVNHKCPEGKLVSGMSLYPCFGGTCDIFKVETPICNADKVTPVDGGWGPWGDYTDCSAGCGGGQRSRRRACDSPAPAGGGQPCSGDDVEVSACNEQPCPVDGGYSDWTPWSECNQGESRRSRACDDPSPAYGGSDCTGPPVETKACPVAGGLSEWSEWGGCVDGTATRTRACNNPTPLNGGAECDGPLTETKDCSVDGGWSGWSEWGSCDKDCGSGQQSRSRACDSPSPLHGGAECSGSGHEARGCNDQPCPINGGLSAWGVWSDCVGGRSTRSRDCNNPTPAHGGSDCSGHLTEVESCEIPVEPEPESEPEPEPEPEPTTESPVEPAVKTPAVKTGIKATIESNLLLFIFILFIVLMYISRGSADGPGLDGPGLDGLGDEKNNEANLGDDDSP